jgi:predicted heme/steroid binding protein
MTAIAACCFGQAGAREEFSERTGKGCSFCHRAPSGGPLNSVGIAYARNGYRYPIPPRILRKSETLSNPFHRTLRLIFGYIHLVAASILVGTIFYVHVFIKPGRLTRGIPRGERRLGLSCMGTLLVTGIYLSWYRLDSLGSFLESHFGILLLVKIILFGLMLTSALLAVTVVHSAMRRKSGEKEAGSESEGAEIADFDGEGGRKAYFIYKDRVYDVSGSDQWEDGSHFGKHRAGSDMTGAMEDAPHGEEVLERVPAVSGEEAPAPEEQGEPLVRKVFVFMAYANMILILLILLCVNSWLWGFPVNSGEGAEAAASAQGECTDCHRSGSPGIYHDWDRSVHSLVGVTCSDCHRRKRDDRTVSIGHLENTDIPVSALVTPGTCAKCHPGEAEEYGRSKHAHTLEIIAEIDKWMLDGMNNRIERVTGCYACHGSRIRFEDGRLVEGSWPNVGVGRVNPDGSLGSCTSCHTRHRFSVAEARKPEACDQCHLGPDHPQIEIFNESKHGTMYHAYQDSWDWRPEDNRWLAGRDYRAPTCAACHMSEADTVAASHDVTRRLSWELQAPLTIRPSEFAPHPSGTGWRLERRRMKTVCLQCHSPAWTNGHFANLDSVIANYNEVYYRPVRAVMDRLYSSGILSAGSYFDEYLEWEFYEFWHHEGRRARMGAAMMAPDYAWWHGFYEVKHRYLLFMEEAEEAERAGKSRSYPHFPGKLERTPGN